MLGKIKDVLAGAKIEDILYPDKKALIITISANNLPEYIEGIQLEDALEYEMEEWEVLIEDILKEISKENDYLDEDAIDISVLIGHEEEDENAEEIKEIISNTLKDKVKKVLS